MFPSCSQTKTKKKNKMKTLKVYGVYGMVEKGIAINHKGVRLNLMFSGGSANANGVIPAKYSTDNPVIQQIIEGSTLFQKGNIRLVRKINVAEPGDVVSKPIKKKVSATEEEVEIELQRVYVPNIESDGKQYLVDNFDVKPNALRSKSQIIKEAEQRGIRFTTKQE